MTQYSNFSQIHCGLHNPLACAQRCPGLGLQSSAKQDDDDQQRCRGTGVLSDDQAGSDIAGRPREW